MSKNKQPMARLINKLDTLHKQIPDSENAIVRAEIFHDGSFNVIEYLEDDINDGEVIESGNTIAELESFVQRKIV